MSEASTKKANTEAAIQRATAALEQARLNLSYTVVVAPCDGQIGRRNIEEGQFIAAGTPITNIIPEQAKWVIANFRETQTEHLRVGQEVLITIDAIKGREYTGHITSIAGATGSKFSAVPTDNSAGNFVKIQQRIPVRIDFDGLSQEGYNQMAAGMMAGVKEPRLKAVTAIVPAIADISKSAMAGFFRPEDEVKEAKEAYEQCKGGLMYLNFMPRAFDEGAAYYYSSRGTHLRWSNQVVAWSQLELVKYNVVNIMKDMAKPYLVITGENAWSREASTEVFNAVPHSNKEMHVIPEASHFDMYDLAPFVSEAFEFIVPFFNKNL